MNKKQHLLDAAALKTVTPDNLRNRILELQTQLLQLEGQNDDLILAAADSARNEKQIRMFMENSCDVLFTLDSDGCFKFISSAWERQFGYPVADVLGNRFQQYVHPDDVTHCDEYFQNVMSGARSLTSTPCRIKYADGSWRWLETTGMPYVDANGTLMFIGAARNVTERKQVKTALQESEEKYRAIVEAFDGCIYICSKEGRIEYVSDKFIHQTGRDVIGEYCYKVIFNRDSTCDWCMSEPVFRGKSTRNEFKHPKDGRWYEAINSPIYNQDGTISRQSMIVDITESKKLKSQLVQSQKMEAAGQLAGGLAHDFNNLLSIINGYCCLLKMELSHDDEQKEYVEQILAASGRAGELTHSMLAFSRTQIMNPQNQNLNMIVSSVGAFVKRVIGENIHFKTVIKDADLPVYVDSGQIEQVLINLANNARDAMPDGGELTIATDLMYIEAPFASGGNITEAGAYAVITVTDNGTGMDKTTRKKVFEPFFTTKEVGKGTGLGLAMVYGIVTQHNGFVDLSSEPGHGTSFVIFLPIVEAENAGHGVEVSAGVESWAGTETILVIEDDAALLEFMHKILVKLGYRVIMAVDGQDGVDTFCNNADAIQLVITDMVMPRKSGRQVYDEIRQIKPEIRMLFSSGYSANVVTQLGTIGENAEFLLKPVQPSELLKKVREMLDR